MAGKKAIMIYLDSAPQWDMLSYEQKGKLIEALMSYGSTGEESDIDDPVVKMAYIGMKATLDRDSEKYDERCKKNAESARKRWSKKESDSECADVPDDANVCEGIFSDAKDANRNRDRDINRDKDIDSDRERDRDTAAYGSHVTLTPQEYKNLVSDYGRSTTEEYISRVNKFCSRSGKKYKDYFSTIQEWMRKDGVEKFDSSKYDFFINRIPNLSTQTAM